MSCACGYRCFGDPNFEDPHVRRIYQWTESSAVKETTIASEKNAIRILGKNTNVLKGQVLNGIDFSGKSLEGFNLQDASLARCNFEGSELLGAEITAANITNVKKLTSEQLSYAYFIFLSICKIHSENCEEQEGIWVDALISYVKKLIEITNLYEEKTRNVNKIKLAFWSGVNFFREKAGKKDKKEVVILRNPYRKELFKRYTTG